MTNRIVSVDETFTLPAPVRAKLETDLGATSPGEMLGVLAHSPSAQEQYSNPSGSTLAAIAPGVLVVSFTAPDTGRVLVQMEAQVNQCAADAGFWAVQSSGTVVPGTTVRVVGQVPSGQGGRAVASVVAADLTPGVSYTFTWATAVMGTGAFQLRAGGTGTGAASAGPAMMIVRAAPGA